MDRWQWIGLVFSSDGPKSPTSRLVLAALCRRMDSDGSNCYPSTRTLAVETGLSERSVCTHLELLSKAGWIDIRERVGNKHGWRLNQYFPRIPGTEGRSAPSTFRGAEGGSVPKQQGAEGDSARPDTKVLNLVREGTEPHDRKVLNDVQPTNTVTSSTTREKRNRASRSATPKGTRLALDSLPDDWRAFARTERPDLDAGRQFQIFADYWRAQPGQKGVKVDWTATWRNWIRRESQSRAPTAVGGRPVDSVRTLRPGEFT